jgi:hypothetical protein
MSERLGEMDYLDVLNQPSGEPELAAQASKKRKAKRSAKQIAAAKRNLRLAHMKRRAKKKGRHKAKTMTIHPNKRRGGVARTYNRKGELVGKKRVASAKQRAAAKRNIKKAQAALKAKRHGKTHRLTPRRRARSTSATTEAKTMSKRSKGKRSKGKRKARRTAAQKAAARKNIKKAQKALRAKGKRSGSRKKGKTLAKRRAHRTAVAPPKPRKAMRRKSKGKGRRRFTQKARAAAMRNLGKARAARRRAKAAGRKHNVRSYSYHSKPKRVHVPGHRSYEKRGHKQSRKARAASLRNLKKARSALRHGGRRRSGHRARESYMEAMVNALSGVEVVIGFGSALFWFMMTDLVDRLLATHALTDKGTKDASGHELYADTPPTSGDYAGLFNATAICAPMNVWRWLVGLGGMTGVPLLISFAVSNDVGRASLQSASFGAGIRIVGKALIDLVAYVTMWNPIGQQLYDGEMRSQVMASGNTDPLASLPSSGLGKVEKKAGTGEAPAKEQGTGWPSTPREVARSGDNGAPPPPAPAVPTTSNPSPPQAGQPGYLAGLPPKRKSLYEWANREDSVAA